MNRYRESGADNENLVSPLGGTFVPGIRCRSDTDTPDTRADKTIQNQVDYSSMYLHPLHRSSFMICYPPAAIKLQMNLHPSYSNTTAITQISTCLIDQCIVPTNIVSGEAAT